MKLILSHIYLYDLLQPDLINVLIIIIIKNICFKNIK